jgi:hypothetical protein
MYSGLRARAFYGFGMAPGRAPIVLAPQLWGAVVEAVGGLGPIVGATVEILDGPYAGKTSTNTRGDYSFAFFPVGSPFTIQASKAGYETVTKNHPGIVYEPFAAPRSFLNIVLPRTQ